MKRYTFICPICHFARLDQHPDLTKAYLGYLKCPTCGYTQLPEINNMKYITMEEYLGNHSQPLDDEIIANSNTIVPKANDLLEKFGEYRQVTSGLRSMSTHLSIYKKINDKRIAQGLLPVHIPIASKHLKAQAVDLEDSNGKLYKWAFENQTILESIGLWAELNTIGWLHIQCVQYGSYHPGSSRFFIA